MVCIRLVRHTVCYLVGGVGRWDVLLVKGGGGAVHTSFTVGSTVELKLAHNRNTKLELTYGQKLAQGR